MPKEALKEPEKPAQEVSSKRGDQMQPAKVLNEAIKAVPAVKYALGIGGVIALIAIVKGFGIDYRVAGFGAVIMLVLMTMLVVFAKLAAKPESDFHLQARNRRLGLWVERFIGVSLVSVGVPLFLDELRDLAFRLTPVQPTRMVR